jgi:hypothetical protein
MVGTAHLADCSICACFGISKGGIMEGTYRETASEGVGKGDKSIRYEVFDRFNRIILMVIE